MIKKPEKLTELVSLLKFNKQNNSTAPTYDDGVQTAAEAEQVATCVDETESVAAQEETADRTQIFKRMKSHVTRQIVLAVLTVVLVVTLIFAMSLSWYTNVSKTGDLQLQTEAWGFSEDNIELAESSKNTLAPGKTVIVPLTVDNSEGASAVKALVTVDKSGAEEVASAVTIDDDDSTTVDTKTELLKRIYFYVDKGQTYTFVDESGTVEGSAVEGVVKTYDETVSRVYIGSDVKTESYCYTLLAGEKLTLSDEFCSDAALCCEWVTDLQGYYFKGTVSDGGVVEDEYLRPVSYDLDSAVFEDNALASIGNVSVDEYVRLLTENDGYKGSFTLTEDGKVDSKDCITITSKHKYTDSNGEETVELHKYYKIDVDEKGEGIWLYLCCETEIDEATRFDSDLIQKSEEGNDDMPTIEPTVKVTASAVEQTETKVSTVEELTNAIENSNAVLVLQNDITLTEPIEISSGKTIQINLNDYAIDFESIGAAFTVPTGGKLTLLNGTLSGKDGDSTASSTEKRYGVMCTGGEVTLGNVTITDMDTAVMMDDSAENDGENSVSLGDSFVKITGCTLDTGTTNSAAIVILGNGSKTTALSHMIVQDSTITSKYIGISGQGADSDTEQWGTELSLMNCVVSGDLAGVFLPQKQSTATIVGSTISGNTGAVVKGGTVTVYGSTITGKNRTEVANSNSSPFANTGDGIYVEATNDWRATVILRGSENVVDGAASACAVELYGEKDKGPGTITIEGGTFKINGVTNDDDSKTIHTNGIGTVNIQKTNATVSSEAE